MTTAPWRGVPLIAGLFTLLGVTASQLVIYVNERRRHSARLEADVRACTVRLLSASRRMEEPTVDVRLFDELVASAAEVQIIAPAAIAQVASDVMVSSAVQK